MGVFGFFPPLYFFLLVCCFCSFFARSVAVPWVVPNSQYAFNSTTPGLLLLLYLLPPTAAAASVCTCDSQHSPPLAVAAVVNRQSIIKSLSRCVTPLS